MAADFKTTTTQRNQAMKPELAVACAKGLDKATIKEAKKGLPEGESVDVFGYVKVYGQVAIEASAEVTNTAKYSTLGVMARMLQELGVSPRRAAKAFREACRCANDDKIDELSTVKKALKDVIAEQPMTERQGAAVVHVAVEEITKDDLIAELMEEKPAKLELAA